MGLTEALDAVRRSWVHVLVCVALGLGLGAALTATQPVAHSATANAAVTAKFGDDPAMAPLATAMLSSRLPAYQEVVQSRDVLDEVIARLDLDEDAGDLARSIDVTAAGSLITVRASAADPDTARDVAATALEVSAAKIQELEVGFQDEATIQVTPIASADDPLQVSPTTSINLLAGFVLGVLLGLVVALVRARRRS